MLHRGLGNNQKGKKKYTKRFLLKVTDGCLTYITLAN